MKLEKQLDHYSMEELIEFQKPLLQEVTSCLCRLITREIDHGGIKKRVRSWLGRLREIRADLSQAGGVSGEVLSDILSVEEEAESYLFFSKKGETQ